MELTLLRGRFTEFSTIGRLSIGPLFECFILEDKDRGLTQDMPLDKIAKIKVQNETCIPYGRYEIKQTLSNRFKIVTPILVNVPGYTGIRIHPGNYNRDTDGCLLPGKEELVDMVTNSRVAFQQLNAKINIALMAEPVFITIKKA